MRKLLVCCVAFQVIFSGGVLAAQNSKALLGTMAEQIPVAGVSTRDIDVRVAVTEGVGYLLGLAMEQMHTGLFVPPGQNYRATGVTKYEVRYRWSVRTLPVFEYKNFKTTERDRYGNLVEVTRRRPVKQIGTKEDKYLTRDDNGDVVKVYNRAGGYDYTDPIGPAYWWDGTLGQNGLCLYTMLKAGVPLDTDPLAMTIETLRTHLKKYGLPDRTWDVAWLTAAFSNLPKGDEELEMLKKRLANKLLLGQVDVGSGKGLWGPICVNPDIVAAMMKYEQIKYGKALAKIKAELKKDPKKKSTQRKLEELDGAMESFADQYKLYTRTWNTPNPQQIFINLGGRDDVANWVIIPGMPQFIYGESLADISSTRLALFALREAKLNGCLPDRTLMPKDAKNGRDLVPARQTRSIISNGLRAVARLGARDGSWSEGNTCAAITAFDSFGFVGLPVKSSDLPKLKSDSTTLSAMAGYASLQMASSFDGANVSRSQLVGTASFLAKRIPKILAEKPKGNTEQSREPYKLALMLASVPSPSPIVSGALVDYLLASRESKIKGWGYVKCNNYYTTSSLVRHTDETLYQAFKDFNRRDPKAYPEFNDSAKKIVLDYRKRQYWRRQLDDILRTAGAVTYLSNATQAPAVGVWSVTGSQQKDVILPRVFSAVQKSARLKKPLSKVNLDADLSNLTPDIPILFVSGSGAFAPDASATTQLKNYLEGFGLMVSFASASLPGLTFLDEVEKVVLKLLPGLKIKRFLLAGGKAELQVVVREDGTVAMASFAVGQNSTALDGKRPILPGAATLRLMAEVFKTRLGPERLSEQPVVDLARLSEIQQSIIDAPAEK